ncbi:uncharacterized protein LOC119110174 [Pollicipes pollicipes]|uniref:uncharacterized protein LOC119110174 n=1 Tax=Pollicipes pollicipes TaxID=41117 RepID=UPI001884962F|nr:uncharacterized protein LOC119110174 [Pollicipes pollicipes]
MDPLPHWSDTEPELDATQLQEHAELDNISPTLIASSISDLHASYLLNDLNSDFVLGDCERTTLALDYVPPAAEPPHSHGPYPCTFSADTCPLNPFSDDPLFGEDHLLMTPETAVTLRSASSRSRVTSPDTPSRPVGRRPQHTKPSLSYVNLITLALLNSETGSLRCNEIYDFLQ